MGLHLANAVALVIFYLREWGRLVAGFVRSLARRRIVTDSERLAWLIVIATIPVGAIGLAFEHTFRTLFAKPLAAAIFLSINGRDPLRRRVVPAAEPPDRWRRPRRGHRSRPARSPPAHPSRIALWPRRRTSSAGFGRSGWWRSMKTPSTTWPPASTGGARPIIGASQSLALLAGISREGVTMVGGLYRGLTNEGAIRFAFLLSAPVIFAAGALKVPDLLGPLGNGIRGQVIVGTVAALLASFASIAFLSRYFKTRTLIPFAVYSLAFGLVSVIHFGI